ncbi:efflux transporter outer membrane subunit [Halosquirtibacter xylanolyticus]|nr:efflux transporter outer membrane subunit [Prolixibacteraceae bacterium]
MIPEGFAELNELDSIGGVEGIGVFFQDSTLCSLISEGLESNKLIQQAWSKVAQSSLNKQLVRNQSLPTFGYQSELSFGNSKGQPSASSAKISGSASATVNWEVDLWGKYRRLDEIAEANYQGTIFNKQALQLNFAALISTNYIQLGYYKDCIDVAKKTAISRNTQYQNMLQKYDHGLITIFDIKRAEIQVKDAENLVFNYLQQQKLILNQLTLLSGIQDSSYYTNISLSPLHTQEVQVGIPSLLLARRPDIRQAEQMVIASNANIGVYQAMRLPSFNLTGLLGVASGDLISFNNGSPLIGGGTLDLFGPIFNFKSNKLKVKLAQEETNEAKLNYQWTVETAFTEVQDALSNIDLLKIQFENNTIQMEKAHEVYLMAMDRYNAGLDDYDTLLNTENTYLNYQLNVLRLKSQLLESYITLYKALGGNWN